VLVTSPIASQLLRGRLDQVLLGHNREICDPLKHHLHVDGGERARRVQYTAHDKGVARQGAYFERV
jgi:hypothetical protein